MRARTREHGRANGARDRQECAGRDDIKRLIGEDKPTKQREHNSWARGGGGPTSPRAIWRADYWPDLTKNKDTKSLYKPNNDEIAERAAASGFHPEPPCTVGVGQLLSLTDPNVPKMWLFVKTREQTFYVK